MELRLCLLLLLVRVSASEESGEGAGYTLGDYLPMYKLTTSRSAAENTGATKSLFYDFLPSELGGKKANHLEVRSLYSGEIKVIQSAHYGVSVNISSMNTFTLSSVQLEYAAVDDTVILQLKNVEPRIYGGLSSLVTLSIVLGSLLCLTILATCAYLCFWKMKFKQHKKLTADVNRTTTGANSIASDARRDNNESATDSSEQHSRLVLQEKGKFSGNDNTITSRPSSLSHRRQRYRASVRRDISSSEDMSSIDDNWTKRKASWKRTQGHKKTQFKDVDLTSGDGGFSSSNEFRPSRMSHRIRNRIGRRKDRNVEDLEWDEYEMGERSIPPPISELNGWQFSTDDEQHNMLPPPLDELMLPSDHSERGSDSDLHDVREAIHNAMDSVNSEASPVLNRAEAKNPESPHDDGYETGVVLNGHLNQSSPTSKLSPPPVAPKPGGGGAKFGSSRLPMSVVMSIALLSIVAGVYGVSSTTEVTIIVFVPDKFFQEINFFINDTSRIDFDISRKPPNTAVHLFEASNPILDNVTVNLCEQESRCQHGCNRKTGTCACSHGYMLFEEYKCADRSDCLYLPCAHTETCTNTIGGYTCTCAPGYWKDSSGTCISCDGSSCPTGTYEAQGCPIRECVGCRTSCPEGQYITAACTAKSDTKCADCVPPCQDDEYEYKPCTSFTNRKCNNISELPAAQGSSGLVLESVSNRKNGMSRLIYTSARGLQFDTALIRGSGISIRVSVKSVNLYPTLKPVDHRDSNDNEAFIENDEPATILTTYCPYPLPLYYELLAIEHTNVTAAKTHDCLDCPIDPRKPCATYKKFGTEAALHPHNKSMVCSRPDRLADMFNLNEYLSESSSMVVQPSEECAVLKDRCDDCSRSCAQNITNQRNTNCSITSEDDANSWSPRLMYCQNCCLNRLCKSLCENVQRCRPVSCWRGNVAEFLLNTKFPQKDLEFFCNVELDERVPLISLDYTVLHTNTELKTFSVNIQQNESSVRQTSFSDGLLTIDYTTGLTSVPDLIHGEVNLASLTTNYSAGRYAPVGEEATRVQVSRLNVRPKNPFSFSTKWWREKNCSETIVDRFLIGGRDGIMSVQNNINVTKHDDYIYTLWNKSHQPSIRFRIPVSVSVIKKLYPPTAVDASNVNVLISRVSAGWKLTVSGEVKTCPGYFLLKVWELEKTLPLADYEVAAGAKSSADNCNRRFFVTFHIAGGDTHLVQRKFRVEIVEKHGRRHFTLAESDKPPAIEVPVKEPAEVSELPQKSSRSAILIIMPYVMIIVAAVIILSIAWIVSVVIPRDYGPVKSGPNSRGALFFCYAQFRVIYIFATSLSLFLFIWYAINSVDLVIVQNYANAVDTVISEQQHDLRALVDFSTQTVQRQTKKFKLMRSHCFSNIELFQNESQRRIHGLSSELNLELSSLPLKNDLVTSLDQKARELKDKLESYRQKFNDFAQISSTKLALELSKTSEDFVKMDWLEAARIIRGAHASRRQSPADFVKGFKKWMGLRTQVSTIQTNFLMDPLPISDIDSLVPPPVPPPPEFRSVDLQSVFLPTHDLYSQIKQPQVSRLDKYTRSYGFSLGSRLSLTTILILLFLLDLLTLTSKVAETIDTGGQILNGYMVEKTYENTYQDGCSSEKYIAKKVTKRPNRVRYRLYKLIITTNCMPMTMGLVVAVGMTFSGLLAALNFVSVESLDNAGLFSSLVGPWNLTSNIALDNIRINRERINMVEIPSTEAMMNAYIERIEILNNVYNNLSVYKWQIECGDSPSDRCGEFDLSRLVQPLKVKDIDCALEPIPDMDTAGLPRTLTNARVQKLILPYIEAFRRIAETTACLLLTYASYLLIVKMLSVVLWNFFTRTAHIPGVRVKVTNQLSRKPETTNEKPGEDEIPTHMPFNRSTIDEMSQEDDDSLEDEGRSEDPSQGKIEDNEEPKLELQHNGDLPALHY